MAPEGSADLQGPRPAQRTVLPTARRVRFRELPRTARISRILTVRDFKVRIKQSALGPAWILIQPLGLLIALTAVFQGVTDVGTSGVPYVLFALVGITVWAFVQTTLSFGVACHVQNRHLLRQLPAPRVAFVTASVAASLPQVGLMLVAVAVAMIAVGPEVTARILALPLCMAWLLTMTWALLLLLSTTHVLFRDVGSAVPLLLQAGTLLAPVGYPTSDAPPAVAALLNLNPFTGLIEAWRWSILGGEVHEPSIVIAGGWTVLLLLASWQIFVRMEPRFADVI